MFKHTGMLSDPFKKLKMKNRQNILKKDNNNNKIIIIIVRSV